MGGLAAAIASSSLAAEAPRGPISFCLAAHNLPFSTSHPPWGIDGELVRKLGEQLNRPTSFVWISEEEETPEEALREGRCEVATGAIVEADGLARPIAVPGLELTEPYYTAGYVLIHEASRPSPRSLADVGEERIGVEMISIPIYTLKQQGRRVYALDDTEAVVRAVADGRASYGYVWGPVGAWLLRERSDVVLGQEYQPEEKWSFALAVRSGADGLRAELNQGLAELTRSGVITAIFEDFGIPYLPPPRGQ